MRYLVVLLVLAVVIQTALGAKIVVNLTSPACTTGDAYYSSIQTAITNANPGDTIVVCPGTYYEVINVDKTDYKCLK